MTNRFPLHTPEAAPAEAREALSQITQRLGFTPTMYAKQAEAPALFEAYRQGSALFDKTSLTATERLVVQLAVSRLHDCDFCVSAHSWAGHRAGVDDAAIVALRDGAPIADAKLQTLRVFTETMVLKRGAVSDQDRALLFAAGYTPRQALEVVLGIGLKVLTNYTNGLARTPPNPEFGEENLWRRSAEG
jgi:AhpD family alkylhydroperoxidase